MLDSDGILIIYISLSSKKLRIAPQSLPLAKTSEFLAAAQKIISRSIYHQGLDFFHSHMRLPRMSEALLLYSVLHHLREMA